MYPVAAGACLLFYFFRIAFVQVLALHEISGRSLHVLLELHLCGFWRCMFIQMNVLIAGAMLYRIPSLYAGGGKEMLLVI